MPWGITDRRHFMTHIAGAAAVASQTSLFFSNLLAAAGPTATTASKRKFKSIIWLNLPGGASMMDLWDNKPGHANNGDTKSMETAVSGIKINELLPTIAKEMKSLAIIRSLTKTEGDHNRGTVLTQTGRTPNPLVTYPSFPATFSWLNREYEADLPSFISIGGGGSMGPGFLGNKFAAFTVQNPGAPPENIKPPTGVDEARMIRREKMFEGIESGFQTKAEKDAAKAHQELYEKAFSLVVSKNKEVFLLDKEPTKLKDDYGTSNFGKGMMLARRLVEAGAASVSVELGGWDMHANIFTGLARQLPIVDKAIGTLVRDLRERGLLGEVAFALNTEFQRTPRINANTGRDHYPRTNSILIGGAGIKGGQVYGSTDAGCETVKENPVTMGDVFATLYTALGIKVEDSQYRDQLGRPSNIAGEKAKVIKELV